MTEFFCIRLIRSEYAKKTRKEYENHLVSYGFNEHRVPQARPDGVCNSITTVGKDNLILCRTEME